MTGETIHEAEGRLRGEELVEELRDMEWPEREEFMNAFVYAVTTMFCRNCWSSDLPCHCANDE